MGAAVIVLAGGSATRMGAEDSKVFASAAGRPLLAYSLEVCALAPSVTHCVVVTRAGEEGRALAVAGGVGGIPVSAVCGGVSRYASELCGLEAVRHLTASHDIDVIAIHDAARPFATVDLYEQVIAAARTCGGAVPGVEFPEPVFDTSGGVAVRRRVGEVIRVQTPQAFRTADLIAAYATPVTDRVPVDTAEVVERSGRVPVAVVSGDARNLKVTYAADLPAAEQLARSWSHGRWTDRSDRGSPAP